MSRSRARLAADWFAKLRQNEVTNEVEHTNVTDVVADVTTVSNTALHSGSPLNAANLTGALPAIDGSALTGVGASTTTGAVGTYAFLMYRVASTLTPGQSVSGSSLRYGSVSSGNLVNTSGHSVTNTGATAPSGTWRCMGQKPSGYYNYPATLYVRIS
jgi:hypothetical protein